MAEISFSNLFQKLRLANKKPTRVKKFGTFGGVFTPDVLTILGVIMYLRLGWVIGNAGFLGAAAIIILSKLVVFFTGLSMSSITTNIKIGAGGAYSIISKSLGLEAGGSIGLPLYIAQTLSAALYIFGFTEAWIWIFPNHTPIIVAAVAWLGLLTISAISAHFAIKIQYVIMAVIASSLISFVMTPTEPVTEIPLIGTFEDASFWQVFAIFFPAVTGIMAGANMSGDLRDPRRAIPLGTISAIAVTFFIYLGLAYFTARFISVAELRANQLVMVDKALWGPIVIAGIMGATLSSALGSMIGAPRILQALAEQKTTPFHKTLAAKTKKNEPFNAIVVTGVIIISSLLMGNLDAIAALLTMFFLITYGMLNLVVFIQQSMKIISFRPTFRIPLWVSFLGATACIAIMFLINAVFSVIAIVIIIALYVWLERRELTSDWGDLRGGIFFAVAEKAARLSRKYQRHQVSWKPDLLVPVEEPKLWAGPLLFIRNITYPSGSIYAFTIKDGQIDDSKKDLEDLLSPLHHEGILVNSGVIQASDFQLGAKLVIQTLKGVAFTPNILFMTLSEDSKKDDIIDQLSNQAIENDMGVSILWQHPRKAFGMHKTINLWLRDKSPNWHLAVLVALQLQMNWQGQINLVTAAPKKDDKKRLGNFLERLSDRVRMPSMTESHVLVGSFDKCLQEAPQADINIFGLGQKLNFKFMREAPESTKSSCLFVKKSGLESAIA